MRGTEWAAVVPRVEQSATTARGKVGSEKRFGLTPVMRRDRALEWQAVTAEMTKIS